MARETRTVSVRRMGWYRASLWNGAAYSASQDDRSGIDFRRGYPAEPPW
jgi:hypothetical protein